jgi:hypothetical protein
MLAVSGKRAVGKTVPVNDLHAISKPVSTRQNPHLSFSLKVHFFPQSILDLAEFFQFDLLRDRKALDRHCFSAPQATNLFSDNCDLHV